MKERIIFMLIAFIFTFSIVKDFYSKKVLLIRAKKSKPIIICSLLGLIAITSLVMTFSSRTDHVILAVLAGISLLFASSTSGIVNDGFYDSVFKFRTLLVWKGISKLEIYHPPLARGKYFRVMAYDKYGKLAIVQNYRSEDEKKIMEILEKNKIKKSKIEIY